MKQVDSHQDIDRCPEHGVWFDDLALAKLFEIAHGVVSPMGYGHGKLMKVGKKTL